MDCHLRFEHPGAQSTWMKRTVSGQHTMVHGQEGSRLIQKNTHSIPARVSITINRGDNHWFDGPVQGGRSAMSE
jgi:hypothetical protein